MTDLTNARWIKLKGLLFLVLGVVAAILILLENFNVSTGLLLLLCVWSFCRFYYFAFYVIEHHVDSGYRFAGLWSFARYLLRRQEKGLRGSKDSGTPKKTGRSNQ